MDGMSLTPSHPALGAQGLGWKAIAHEMKLGVGTVLRAAQQGESLGS